jgi:PIN domain nuclease of toxin-antitoxin system
MKSYLLDTHIFLNAYIRQDKNSKRMTKIIDSDSPKYLSAISLVEIAQLLESKPKEIKIDVPLATFLQQALTDLQVEILAITPEHAQRFYEIQMIKDHKDQYDRTIIAQAASTGFTVLSDDIKFPFYPIELISNNL